MPLAMVPRDRNGLDRYLQAKLADGTVGVGKVGAQLARDVLALTIPQLGLFYPLYHRISVATALMSLPEQIRDLFGISMSPWRARCYHIAGRTARTMVRRLPLAWRTDPLTRPARARYGQV